MEGFLEEVAPGPPLHLGGMLAKKGVVWECTDPRPEC